MGVSVRVLGRPRPAIGPRSGGDHSRATAQPRAGRHLCPAGPRPPRQAGGEPARAGDPAERGPGARVPAVGVSDGGPNRYLTFTSLAAHGEEVCAVTRLGAAEKLPQTLTVRGTLDGRPFERELAVKDVAAKAGYLPRTWAKLEIERLLAEDALEHKKEIVELSKAMCVMTPFTSLLVLESEAMYQQYKVERGRKDHWALYGCPDKIPVFPEDED